MISHCGKCCHSFVFFTFSQCCVSDFSLWNACQVFWSWPSLDNHFSLWSLSSSWLQRPIRGRHSNLRSNWRKSPKWRKHWARDHPPSPRARSSQASLRLSAQTGQRWLQQPQIAQGRWNQEKEAPWLRTACWARISTLRSPLSCWLSFQVDYLLIYRTVEMQNELYSSQIGLCNNWHSSVPLNLCKTLTLWSSIYILNSCTVFREFQQSSFCKHTYLKERSPLQVVLGKNRSRTVILLFIVPVGCLCSRSAWEVRCRPKVKTLTDIKPKLKLRRVLRTCRGIIVFVFLKLLFHFYFV